MGCLRAQTPDSTRFFRPLSAVSIRIFSPLRFSMPINGIDHVEFYVGNAAQAAYYFVHAFGFTETAYKGLETGHRGHRSHVVEQGVEVLRAGKAKRLLGWEARIGVHEGIAQTVAWLRQTLPETST